MMNPTDVAATARPLHAYADENAAHQGWLTQLHARRLDCIANANEAMTKDEKTFWGKYENYLGIVERSLTGMNGLPLTREATMQTRKTLRTNLEKEFTALLDKARTTTEKEIVAGCLEALEEGLRMHSSHTGIY